MKKQTGISALFCHPNRNFFSLLPLHSNKTFLFFEEEEKK